MAVEATSYDRSGIASDDSVPSGDVMRVAPKRYPEVAWYLTAASETDTCTVTNWQRLGGDWHKGESADVVGSTVVTSYTLSGECAVQLTNVAGTWRVRAKLLEKEA